MFFKLAAFILSLFASPQTWYIRTDGGTSTQCTGLANAAYPGSGTAQACAFSSPMYLWTDDPPGIIETATWKIAAGDTVIIANGTYRMGWKTNAADGSGDWNYHGTAGKCAYEAAPGGNKTGLGCTNPTFPANSGPNYTRILGQEHASGCAVKPKLVGGANLSEIFNLRNASYVQIECLEMTDNDECSWSSMANPALRPYACNSRTIANGGDWTKWAIAQNLATNHTIFKNLFIHGFSEAGIIGAFGGYVSADRIHIRGVGNIGWNMVDVGSPPSLGPFTMTNSIIEWTGCVEQLPPTAAIPIMWCGDQNGAVISGDAFGWQDFIGDLTIDHVTSRYNMQDPLDLLYTRSANNVTVSNNLIHTNEGNALKTGGARFNFIYNNVLVPDCERNKSDHVGMPNPVLWRKMSDGITTSLNTHCRDSGSFSMIQRAGSTTYAVNNTLVTYSKTAMSGACSLAREVWTSAGRTSYDGTLAPSEALDGKRRFYDTAYPIYGIAEGASTAEGGVLVTGQPGLTGYRVGQTFPPFYNEGTPERFPIESIDTSGDRIVRSGLWQPADGVRIRFWSTTDNLPSPLVVDTYYYVFGSTSTGFQVKDAGGAVVDLTTAGGGTIYFDKDCTGAKCTAYYTEGATGLTLDPSATVPATTATMRMDFYYIGFCDTSKIIFHNNVLKGFQKASTAEWPTVWWGYGLSPNNILSPVMAPTNETRHNNYYCGVIGPSASGGSAGLNKVAPSEVWTAQSCPGTWFTNETSFTYSATNPTGLDGIWNSLTLPSTSPLRDAGYSGSPFQVLTDYAGTVRPYGASPDVGAYEYTPDAPTPALSVSPATAATLVSVPATFVVSGGTTPYTADTPGCTSSVNGIAVSVTCAAAGTYTLTVTDADLSTDTASLTVSTPPTTSIPTRVQGGRAAGARIK